MFAICKINQAVYILYKKCTLFATLLTCLYHYSAWDILLRLRVYNSLRFLKNSNATDLSLLPLVIMQ